MDVLTDTESQQTVQQGAEEMGERQQVQVSCLLRMEDDDDTTVDILSSDGDSWPGILMLGDVYAGHKQAKRYWLINDSELFSIEIVVKPEVDKRIHLIDGEVCIDNTGVMPVCDELPSRVRCIAAYKEHAQETEDYNIATDNTINEGGKPVEVPLVVKNVEMPLSSSAMLPPDTPAGTGRAAATGDSVTSRDQPTSAEHLQPAIVNTGNGTSAPVAPTKGHRKINSMSVPSKDKNTPTLGGSSSANRNVPSYGSNLSVGGELDVQVTWEQLLDGSSGGSAQGGLAGGKGKRGKRAADGSAASRGMLSLSGLCGRQWGQDGVSAELSGSWAVADGEQDASGSVTQLNDLTMGSVMRRPFIGETSRAVRVSRANKSYAKLNGATYTSSKLPPPPPPVVSERKQGGIAEIDDLAAVSQNLASLLSSEDERDDKAARERPRKIIKEIAAVEAPSLYPPRIPTALDEQVLSAQPELSNMSPAKSQLGPAGESLFEKNDGGPLKATLAAAAEPGPGALLRVVLRPQERLQISVIVCPSPLYVDETTGTPYGAELRVRTVPLQFQWKQMQMQDEPQTDTDTTLPAVPLLDIALRRVLVQFRSCVSLISVTPSASEVYELGMCNVGEQRTVVLDVRNDSQLPAVVFPLVESEVLDVAEQEVRIPPSETRQVRLGYLAKTEDAEYWDRVALVNGYNLSNSQVVRIKSRNVDTQQILLHSMFYKLVTYNNMRQLQVAFDRCLINMPNLKVFSIKNVHSGVLRLRLCWLKQSGFRLFLVRATSTPSVAVAGAGISPESADFLASSDVNDFVELKGGSDLSAFATTGSSSTSSRLRASNQQDDIEDLKWGDNPKDFASAGSGKISNRYKRSLSMQPIRKNGAGTGPNEDASLAGVSGDDGSVNYGKGELFLENKSAAVGLSRDIVSVLDLDTSHQASSFIGNSSAGAKDDGDLSAAALSHPRSRSVDNNKEVRFNMAPSPANELPTATASSQTAPADDSALGEPPRLRRDSTSDFETILSQFGKEGFPFTMIEGDDWTVHDLDTGAGGDSTGDGASKLKSSQQQQQKAKGARQGEDRDRDRPHSIGGTSANGLQASKSGTAGGGDGKREKSETELRVKALQRYYTELRFMIDNSGRGGASCLRELFPENLPAPESTNDAAFNVGALVEIPAGVSHRFALLYEPEQRAGADDIEEYMEVRRSDALHIVLPELGASDVATSLDLNKQLFDGADAHIHDDAPPQPHTLPAGGLRPRALPVRASLVRSEMVVIQKNISFGRTVLGDRSSKGVTVVNRSSVPCLYTISKSGSISSGFLQVLGGRKGIIPAFSSKLIEFIFKPTLPGTFEEVLMINNVLNPRDAQAVTIKARVSHTETFVITPANAPEGGEPASPDPQEGDWEAQYKLQLKQFLANPGNALASSNVKSITQYMGDTAIGGEPVDSGTHWISFRIKNVTSKSRQFIVDASHIHAVELLAVTASPSLVPGDSPSPSPSALPSAPTIERLAASFPFEPIPETLQSVLSLRCRFESELLAGKTASSGDGSSAGPENSLSAGERKALEDSLEQFQQKLKIAIRKNKAEKIEKYQKKIDKVIIALQSNKNSAEAVAVPAEAAIPADEDFVPTLPAPQHTPPDAPQGLLASISTGATEDPLPVLPVSQPAAPPATQAPQTHVGESEVSYHFSLEPEQEKLVRVRITFLPGSGYKYWPGLLPFHGFLRIFECKNEDHVKLVRFGAMVRSIRMAVANTIPFSNATAANHSSCDDRVADSPSRFCGSGAASGEQDAAGELIGDMPDHVPITPLSNTQAFIATVAQWSSLPTREVYPKYRQLPNHLLSMCVKLVRASRDRVMHGSLSVASLVEQAGVLSVSVDEEFSSKVSGEYVTYNAQRHGPILFAITHQGGSGSALGPEEELVKGETSSLAAEIGSNSGTGKEKLERGLRRLESESRISAGSKVDFSIQWQPPADLSAAKQSSSSADASTEEGGRSASLRIIGAVKVQLRVGDQLVGLSQSVPFIGVLEHKSIFTVSKYFAFDQISVGSYCTSQVPVTNTSATEELHYLISSEEVSASSRAVGAMDITSGQTGVVRPASTKQLSLFFVASSAGKYEQKLWVRNLRDSFDQKRIVVQANVSVAQTKFVAFPDLEASTDGAFEKYKPIDLGLVQIQGPETSDLVPIVTAMDLRCFYELKVQNVSGKALLVTAVSNLKSQCFIYTDEACTQLAVYSPVAASAVTTLYVKIRPTALAPSAAAAQAQGQGLAVASQSSTETQAASVGAGSGSASAAGVALEGSEALTGAGDDSKAKSKRAAANPVEPESREMKGGIKLVFFAAEVKAPRAQVSSEAVTEQLPSSENVLSIANATAAFPLESSPLKLFETAISFKATVGRSHLKLAAASAAPKSELQYIHSQRGSNYFVGSFELRNTSKLFPLDYAYMPEEGSECVAGETRSYKWWGSLTASAASLRKTEKLIKILDAPTGSLPPGQSKQVTYVVLHAVEASGLVLCPVKVANVSTMELCSKTFAIFLDPQNLRSSLFYKEGSHELIPESRPADADPENACTEGVPGVHPAAQPMVAVQCQGTVWVYFHDQVHAAAGTTTKENTSVALANAEALHTVDDKLVADLRPSSKQQQYVVQGASKAELGSWLFTNTNVKSITFFPASDLPVAVTIIPHVVEAGGCGDGDNDDDDDDFAEAVSDCESDLEAERGEQQPAARKTQGSRTAAAKYPSPSAGGVSGKATSDYSSHISPALLGWRESLRRCGGAFTLQAGGTVRVVVSVKRGSALREAQLQALGGARRLEEGKCGQLSGVVVFLQAAHSLQSLFNPAPVIKTALPVSAAAASTAALGDQHAILPIVNIASLVCDVAAPTIQLEKSLLNLGKFRCNRDTSFEIVVENTSDVDVPCCIDNLPVYMNIERYAIHPLKNQQNNKEGAVLELDVTALESPAGVPLNHQLFLDSQQVLSQFSSPRKPGSERRPDLHLGAQKLQWWLASNGDSISGQGSHGAAQQLPLTESVGLRRGSREQCALGDELQPAHASSVTASPATDQVGGEAGDAAFYFDQVDPGTTLSSLEVNHELYLHQYQNELTLDANQSELFQLHQALMSDRDDLKPLRLFAVPAKRQFRLSVHLKVPLVDTQLLENVIIIKNLTSALIDMNGGAENYVLDKDGGIAVADQKQLKVRFHVDASRALEVIAAIDEPLLPRAPHAVETERKADIDTAATAGTSVAFTRILKDPFMVPPAAQIEYTVAADAGPSVGHQGEVLAVPPPSAASATDCAVDFPRPVRAKSTVAKTHCRFSIKNKLADNIRVQATVEVNPSLVKLLNMKVKFQTNNSGSIDLEPEESCAVKVRVIPGFSGRVTSTFLAEQTPNIAPPRSGSTVPDAVSGANISMVDTVATENNDRSGAAHVTDRTAELLPALKAANTAPKDAAGSGGGGTSVLLGTVRLTPVPVPARPTSPSAPEHAEADSENHYKHDVIVLDIVGYVQAAPTIMASVAFPKPAAQGASATDDAETATVSEIKGPLVLEFRAKARSSGDADREASQSDLLGDDTNNLPSALARAVSPPLPGSSARPGAASLGNFALALPTGKPPSAQPAAAQQSMPVLELVTTSLSLYLANPSSDVPLNYEIKTQSFRHAGMRLLLAGLSSSPTECDTFLVQAEPARGHICPGTASAVKLRLVPGDASVAVKSSTTLNADIPDVQMRDRRLRSHHNREPAAPTGLSGGVASTASGNLPSMVGIAEKALESSAPAEERPKEPVQPAANSSGPYTIACMPIEVWDVDYPGHPPRVVFAYLTSDVPIPIIATQSLAESARGKGSSTAASSSGQPAELLYKDRDWLQEGPRTIGLHGVASQHGQVCHMSLGQVLQRKEVLEWPLVIENRSASQEIQFALTPVFRGDTASWLTLGQSAGTLSPGASMSVMIYFRRSVPPGCYVSYLLVQNSAEKKEVHLVKVSMDIVSDAKRATSGGAGLSSLSSMSNMGLAAAKRERSDDNLAGASSLDKEGDRDISFDIAKTAEPGLSVFASSSSDVGAVPAAPAVVRAPTPSHYSAPATAVAATVRPVFSVSVCCALNASSSDVAVSCGSADDDIDAQGSSSSVGLSLSPISTPSWGASSKSLATRKPTPLLPPPAAAPAAPAPVVDNSLPPLALQNLTDCPLVLSVEYEGSAGVMCLEAKGAEERLVFVGASKWDLSLLPRELLSLTVCFEGQGSSSSGGGGWQLEECPAEADSPTAADDVDGRTPRVQGVLSFTSTLFECQRRKIAVLSAPQDM